MSENLNKLFSPVRVVESLTAAKTLDVYDTGKIFMLNLAGGFTVTLPAPTADDMTGWTATFIVGTNPTTAYIVSSGTADTMSGRVVDSSGGNEDEETAATADQFNFVANTALIGDKLEIICDGSVYHGYAITGATGAGTFTG
mgnify:FL=1